jgi:hypothetical protein
MEALGATSVPIPKLVRHLRRARTNFGIDKDTSNCILIVPLLNPKFASERSANLCELRVRGTSVMLWREQGKMRREDAAFGVLRSEPVGYARDGPLPRSGSLATAAWRMG